jgi:hypothetical protein
VHTEIPLVEERQNPNPSGIPQGLDGFRKGFDPAGIGLGFDELGGFVFVDGVIVRVRGPFRGHENTSLAFSSAYQTAYQGKALPYRGLTERLV